MVPSLITASVAGLAVVLIFQATKASAADNLPPTVPLFSLYSANDRVLTPSCEEKRVLIREKGYVDRGVVGYAFTAPALGLQKIFRYYDESSHRHFYSVSPGEGEQAHYKAETFDLWSSSQEDDGLIGIWRLYLPSTGDHLYTSNNDEAVDAMGSRGYHTEHEIGYVVDRHDDTCPIPPPDYVADCICNVSTEVFQCRNTWHLRAPLPSALFQQCDKMTGGQGHLTNPRLDLGP